MGKNQRQDQGASSRMAAPLYIWGHHPVMAYFQRFGEGAKKSTVLHILGDKTGLPPDSVKEIKDRADFLGVTTRSHAAHSFDWPLARAKEVVTHQRVCLQIPQWPTGDLSDAHHMIQTAATSGRWGCVGLVLDHIEDPRNFGSILRSAAYFGVKFVIFAEDHQAPLSATVVKTSAGGIVDLNLIPVVNISRTLDELKKSSCWVVGTQLPHTTAEDAAADKSEQTTKSQLHNILKYSSLPTDRVYVLVLGNESLGTRPGVLKHCDYKVFVPNFSFFDEKNPCAVDSLNVSVATGVLLSHLNELAL